jgi:hypothetical protein
VVLLARALLAVAGVALALWGALALWFAGPGPAPLRVALAALALAGTGAALRRRSLGEAALGLALVAAALLGWWSTVRPSNDRVWTPDVARIPSAEIDGDLVTLHNVRSFRYASETEFEERWEHRRYDLSKLQSLDLFLSYWGSPNIAHTILSWGFSDGQYLAVSIETRKEVGEAYSPVAGFFRSYEVAYVAADERDVVGLRTNHRGEDVYLYRLQPRRPWLTRSLLESYLEGMNQLAAHPAWYNALTTNCTTTIRLRVLHAGGELPLDWQLLLNGHLPALLYEHGVLDRSLLFDSLRSRGGIRERALAAGDASDFSARIRAPGP